MNYVYIISNDDYFDNYVRYMIESLNRHCDCGILLQSCGISKDKLMGLPDNIRIFDVDKSDWENRILACRIERILKMNFQHNDFVFSLDIDLLIQDDIFKVFGGDFDITYTSRHYKYWAPINSGLWGFRFNERSKKFLEFYAAQAVGPTWQPLVQFRNKMKHTGVAWWVDQDFLCAVYNNKGQLPFECKVVDSTHKYNYCPSPDIMGIKQAQDEMLSKIGNKEYKVLHFKGPNLKKIMEKASEGM